MQIAIPFAYTHIQYIYGDFVCVAHIQTTLDLPDLDLSGVVRETTTRMENMMSHARSAAANVSPNASLTRASSGNSSASANSDSLQRSHTTLH